MIGTRNIRLRDITNGMKRKEECDVAAILAKSIIASPTANIAKTKKTSKTITVKKVKRSRQPTITNRRSSFEYHFKNQI